MADTAVKLTAEQRALMRHALGMDRAGRAYRNRYHAPVGSDECDHWTDLAGSGCAALVHVEKDVALFTVTDLGRTALTSYEQLPEMTDALDELVERLKAASGPMTSPEVEECIRLSPWYADTPSHDPIWSEFCRALYGSIDAAIALTERLLPGRGYNLFFAPDGRRFRASFRLGRFEGGGLDNEGFGEGATLPLAILIATLTALASLNREGPVRRLPAPL